MTKKLLLDAAILLGLALLTAVGYRFAPLLNPKSDLALPLSTCDLGQQSCRTILPDGTEMEFSIEPRPIPALKPLRVEAIFNGAQVRKIEVDFSGSEMKMGYNRSPLERQGGSDRFVGQASLPVCITGSMAWDATVIVDTGKAVVAIPFRFVSGH